MIGPQAPKDPEAQRPYFYIMKEKAVFGSEAEDKKGIQYLYQSDGRLESSAQIVGNVTDQEILGLLGTVSGFRKLVHSIGIAVELENPKEEATFVFQMYGAKDLYGGGTKLICSLPGDGSEKRIYLDQVQWREDDNVPGQIQLIMEEANKTGSLSVRFYLNDGYQAPEQEEEGSIDTASEAYRQMIAKSLIQTGNNKRLAIALEKAKRGEDITIGFIGGSITQGAGATPINHECYAYKTYQKLCDLVGQRDNIHFVKAGVGGTPSELGMVRFERDVVRGKACPDIVIVEFAVNDEGDETKGDCYESLVRMILKKDNAPAVILLFSVFANDFNLEERLMPVGKHYDLPMVSVKRAVTPQFYDKANRLLTKNQFFYDMFHPSNIGHTIMADCLAYLFEMTLKEMKEGKVAADYDLRWEEPAAIGKSFEKLVLMDRKDTCENVEIIEGGFTEVDKVLQAVEMDEDLELTPEFPYNWMYDGSKCSNPEFVLKLKCKSLVLVFKDSGEVDAAKADTFVDGEFVRVADPYINRWLHCNPIILIQGDETREHEVRIRVQEADLDKKFTILGFGIVW